VSAEDCLLLCPFITRFCLVWPRAIWFSYCFHCFQYAWRQAVSLTACFSTTHFATLFEVFSFYRWSRLFNGHISAGWLGTTFQYFFDFLFFLQEDRLHSSVPWWFFKTADIFTELKLNIFRFFTMKTGGTFWASWSRGWALIQFTWADRFWSFMTTARYWSY